MRVYVRVCVYMCEYVCVLHVGVSAYLLNSNTRSQLLMCAACARVYICMSVSVSVIASLLCSLLQLLHPNGTPLLSCTRA